MAGRPAGPFDDLGRRGGGRWRGEVPPSGGRIRPTWSPRNQRDALPIPSVRSRWSECVLATHPIPPPRSLFNRSRVSFPPTNRMVQVCKTLNAPIGKIRRILAPSPGGSRRKIFRQNLEIIPRSGWRWSGWGDWVTCAGDSSARGRTPGGWGRVSCCRSRLSPSRGPTCDPAPPFPAAAGSAEFTLAPGVFYGRGGRDRQTNHYAFIGPWSRETNRRGHSQRT